MELIITEKDNAARRIADILSGESADAERRNGVNVYKWGGKRCVGLSGHVVGVDFPDEYSDWRDVEPVELIDASIEKKPTQENIVATLRLLARDADAVTIATDYDREGELIGKEAYELVRDVNEEVPIQRVRFSSITENEVTDAFDNPEDLDFDLAAAGEARQIIDLIWGAALTRFLSLSAGQLGDDFISVGRVQSPTLKLIVDREREIQAFDPEDYWELYADLLKSTEEDAFEAQYFYRDEDGNEAERVWDEDDADEAHATLDEADAVTVERVNRRTRTDTPPAPFNTTQFIRAAGSLGYSAQRAMSIAEDLYTEGYITYPRTDNTVYPDDLDPETLLDEFVGHRDFGDDAESLLELDGIDPTRGDEETTDHPPIHPTGEHPGPSALSDDEWEVYELVVRRFFATVAEAATWEHLKVVASTGDLTLKSNGKRLVEPGYHDVYPYFSTSENYVPDVDEGEELSVTDVRMEEKQTQPPRRYGQSRLIETMEDMGIGTKCLTADTKVLDRTDGEVERIRVDELFEEGQVVVADGDTDVAVSEDTPTTISFDERTGEIRERETTLVSERPLDDDEDVLDVETPAGSFSVTGEHPLYVATDDGFEVRPANVVEAGEKLLTIRRDPEPDPSDEYPVAVTWDRFADSCDKDSKLYGTGANEAIAEHREGSGQTQSELAAEVDADRSHISEFENDRRDIPVWILGELDIEPDGLHGLNYDAAFDNPFPIRWSPALARILGNLLGDGSIHVNDAENVVDVRYHNTDRRLVDRFVSDVEKVFGVRPSISERTGRETHHKTKYQVSVSSALGRILHFVLDELTTDGAPDIPGELVPAFVGALFDDEGHVSNERKAFISNTDHDLLDALQQQLATYDVDTKVAEDQHKLHVRGRRDLERFLDVVPISSDWKFYRGLDALKEYDVTHRKARVLTAINNDALTTAEIADELGVSRSLAQTTILELKEDGYVETQIEGSNRSLDDNRTFRYSAVGFESSVYATLLGIPSTTTVTEVRERDYDGPVYDLTVDETAPNFAIEGGVIVHNSTRHNTIEKLYDRGYVENDPPRPTQLAMAVVEAAEAFADRVTSEEMTSQLEADMTAIAEGEASFDDVTDESREMLETVFESLTDSREEVGEHLRESLKADKTLGPCPESGHDLLVRRSSRGSAFVGCDGYPDCEYTLPLPNTGKPLILDEQCEEHELQHVKMLAGRQTFVHGCPQCKADEAGEGPVIGDCPNCKNEHDGDLVIKQLRNGSRLVGCTRYPDCDYSLPLPRRGDIEVTDGRCDEHDLPELRVHNGDDEPWELGCPICNYREYQARESDSGTDLEALDGVGAKTAEKLLEAGIESLDDLSGADPDEIAADVDGVSADRIEDWQAEA